MGYPSLHDVSADQLILLKVGELAKRAGKTVRAVHLYEELGLLAPAVRSKGGFRLYHGRAVTRLEWISKLQDLGFSLTEIKAFLRDWEHSETGPKAPARDLLGQAARDPRHDWATDPAGDGSEGDPGLHGQLPVVRS